MTSHQQKQIEVINKIEERIRNNSLTSSVVEPVNDYENDNRLCLTSVHIPNQKLKTKILETIIKPLQKISPGHFYYSADSLHMTIKNIRVINNPPNFTEEDIQKVKEVFTKIIPKYKKFNVYFYRLLVFPLNLVLMGTTDPELDNIFLDLDAELIKAGLPDDKKYSNNKYFFSNMTLARFKNSLTSEFKNKIEELSNSVSIAPYTVDSVTLVSCNAALKKRRIIGEWELKHG